MKNMLTLIWRFWKEYDKVILLYFVFSVIMTVVGVVAFYKIPLSPDWGHINPIKEIWLNVFMRWDGIHYVSIAANGYGVYSASNYAFFPLYPILIWGLTLMTGIHWSYASFFISRFSFLVALIIMYKMLKVQEGQRVALRTIICLSLFPGTFFFLCPYTESIFLLFIVLTFYFLFKEKWFWASFFAMLAGSTKQLGILMGLIVLYQYMRSIDYNIKYIRPNILYLSLIPLGLLLYMMFLYYTKGDALYFLICQDAFDRHTQLPGQPLLTSITNLIGALVNGKYINKKEMLLLFNYFKEIFFSISIIAIIISSFKKIDNIYFLFCIIFFIMPFSTAVGEEGLSGMVRYLSILFPLFIVIAKIKSKWFQYLYVTIGVAFSIIFMMLYSCWYWVA